MKKEMNNRNLAFIFIFILTMLMVGIWECSAQIPQDKKLHIGAGAVSSAFFSTFSMPQNEIWKPAIYGITGAAILGTSKELLDLAGLGTPEWGDLGATMLGGMISLWLDGAMNAYVRIPVPGVW